MARWIPVTESLPESGDEDIVKAWMPLPKPYKEGKSNVGIAENPTEDVR